MTPREYDPIDMIDIALHHKTYRVVHDPSGDFRKGAHIGGHELEFMLSMGHFSAGTLLFNIRSKKTYKIVDNKRGGIKKVVVSDKSNQAYCPVS